MTKSIFKFNLKSLQAALKAPPGKYQVLDSRLPYLRLSVGKTGGSIKYYRNIGGVPCEARLGKLKPLNQEALKRIEENWKLAHALAEMGQNPNLFQGKGTATGNDSKKDTLEWAVREHELGDARENRPATTKQRWRLLNAHAADWLNRRASTLTTDEIKRRFHAIGDKHGRPTANNFLGFVLTPLRNVLGIEHRIKPFPQPAGNAIEYIPKAKVGEFYSKAGELRDSLGKLVQFILLSGLRQGEARKLKGIPVTLEQVKNNQEKFYSYIDFARKSVILPMPKNYRTTRKPFELPLAAEAWELVKNRQGEEWIFSNTRDNLYTGSDVYGAFTKLRTDTEIMAAVSPHNARHTLSTLGRDLGISGDAIEACLQHSTGGIKGVYKDNTFEGKLTAMQQWAGWVTTQADPTIERPVLLSPIGPEEWAIILESATGQAKALLLKAAGYEENIVPFRETA